jgi:surface polysaccharide O-acyltransferase-like enzyme
MWGCLANQIARFAVPLFLIMSGFLLFHASPRQPTFAATDFYRRRFGKILWPYFLWSFLYALLNGFLGASLLGALLQLPIHLLWGTAYYHLYFVVIILQLYLLYPLLYRWMVHTPRICLLTTLALTLICQILLNQYSLGQLALPQQLHNLALVFFPVWIFFFVFGMFAAHYHASLARLVKNHRALLALLWITSLALVVVDGYLHNTYGSSSRPSVMVYTLCSFFFFYALAFHIRGASRPLIDWLARQSFLIYLLHPLVLTGLISLAAWLGYADLWSRTRGMIAIYLLVTLLSCAAVYLVSLTPLAEKMGGVRRHRQ